MDKKQQIIQKMKIIHAKIRMQQFKNNPYGVNNPEKGQGRILLLLSIQPNMPTKDIAYLLNIRQQSLNESLKRLEENEYIKRTPSPEDKRIMIVNLTDKGQEKANQVKKQNHNDYYILDNFSDTELFNLDNYLNKMLDNLPNLKESDLDVQMKNRFKKMKEYMGKERFEKIIKIRHNMFKNFHDFQ